jgi:hypothetical protein
VIGYEPGLELREDRNADLGDALVITVAARAIVDGVIDRETVDGETVGREAVGGEAIDREVVDDVVMLEIFLIHDAVPVNCPD